MEDAYVLQLLEPKFKEFHLCFCGYAECDPLHSYGPATRPNYIIHYILDGKGTYQVGERKYSLTKGQGFLIEPETLTFYQADREDPWSYLWVGFGGNGAAKLVQDIGLNSWQTTFQCNYGEELKKIVFSMLKHTESTTSNLYYLQGRLYDFFSVLTRDIVIDSYEDENKESMYVQKAITYIRNHYSEGITVLDIAEHLNVNRSYLYTIFKNSLELSPKEFLTKFRVSRAKEQLSLTDISVENIAYSCGYRSPLVFTKAFKQEVGMTPSRYRSTNRTETKAHLVASKEELDEIGEKGKKFIHNQRNDLALKQTK